MSSSAVPWDLLPTEMKFSVVELLDPADVQAFSKVNMQAYTLAVPALWRVSARPPVRTRRPDHVAHRMST